jgi:hypothetical protein
MDDAKGRMPVEGDQASTPPALPERTITMTIKTVILSGFAAAAFFSAAVPAMAQEASAVNAEATAQADSYVQASKTDLAGGDTYQARANMEKAETVLLNQAVYDGTATFNPGTGMVLNGELAQIAQARQALNNGNVQLASNDLNQ